MWTLFLLVLSWLAVWHYSLEYTGFATEKIPHPPGLSRVARLPTYSLVPDLNRPQQGGRWGSLTGRRGGLHPLKHLQPMMRHIRAVNIPR